MSWFRRTVNRLTGAADRGRRDQPDRPADDPTPGATRIDAVQPRERVLVIGEVREVRVAEDSPRFEARLADDSGSLWLVFLGRRAVDGVVPGARVAAGGRTCTVPDGLGIFNPRYELLDRPD